MNTLTIYTDNYDSLENISNGGFSGTAFIDNQEYGDKCKAFCDKEMDNLNEALNYIEDNDTPINEVCFCYLNNKNNEQKFKRFKIK